MMHLYLFNDNDNSFNYVYAALMKYVKHVPTQAEQSCMIAHNNGKCHIKQGDMFDLQKIKQDLEGAGLKVELKQEMYA